MLLRLLAAFILVPLVELYLLLWLADLTNVLTTIAVVVVTGIIGSLLAKREGLIAWHRFRTALGQGRMPSQEIQDGLMIVFAAALLLTPGLLTDALGFVLLVPAGRDLIRRLVLKRMKGRFNVQVTSTRYPRADTPYASSARRRNNGYTIDAESVSRKS